MGGISAVRNRNLTMCFIIRCQHQHRQPCTSKYLRTTLGWTAPSLRFGQPGWARAYLCTVRPTQRSYSTPRSAHSTTAGAYLSYDPISRDRSTSVGFLRRISRRQLGSGKSLLCITPRPNCPSGTRFRDELVQLDQPIVRPTQPSVSRDVAAATEAVDEVKESMNTGQYMSVMNALKVQHEASQEQISSADLRSVIEQMQRKLNPPRYDVHGTQLVTLAWVDEATEQQLSYWNEC